MQYRVDHAYLFQERGRGAQEKCKKRLGKKVGQFVGQL